MSNIADKVIGIHSVYHCLLAGRRRVDKIYLNDLSNKRFNKIVDLANKLGIEIIVTDNHFLSKITGDLNHQGVVAICESKRFLNFKEFRDSILKGGKQQGLIVACDQIQDPVNLGSIIRICGFFGVKYLLMQKRRNTPITLTVSKISSGAIEYIDVIRVSNLPNTLKELKKLDYWIIVFDPKGDIDIRDFKFPDRSVIVIGSEGKGVRNIIKKISDFKIKIVGNGKIESMNASQSCVIGVYEYFNRGN